MIVEEKTVASERIFEGRILNLRRDEVTVKNGTSMREIVEHSGGVVIIGITDEGKVPMVWQYRKAAESAVLEIPAGKLEPDEDPMEAALRELKEETGYSAARISPIFGAYSSIGYSTEILHFYLAEGLTPGDTDFDENEAIDVDEYTPDELYDMARDGRLVDQKTIVAAFLARDFIAGWQGAERQRSEGQT
jgi:ADP-ribose pyrophosphatase